MNTGLTIDTGTTAWMLASTALVLFMVPGLAMFYGGLVRTKNILGTMMHSFAAMAIVSVLWAICGYAIAFGPDVAGGWFGWSWHLLFLSSLDSGKEMLYPIGNHKAIPTLVYAMFQCKFAIIAPAIMAGAFAERVKFRGFCVLIVLWMLIVYCPLAHSVWGPGGWLNNLGAIDFAGGTVVHISSAVSGLVAVFYLGRRRGYPEMAMRPSSLVLSLIGAGVLWVGWFGFNAGSAIGSDLEAARALTVTQLAAASAALAWMAIEGYRHHKVSSLGVVSGIVAGLVAITPAAGVVPPYAAIIIGAAAAVVCYMSIRAKAFLGWDDTLDVFSVHGMGGICGALLLAFFIRPGQSSGMGAWHHLWIQAVGVGITLVGAAVITWILVVVVDKTIGLRMSGEQEMAGMDHSLHGEHGFGLLNPE